MILDSKQIELRVGILAAALSNLDKPPFLWVVLDGGFMFGADLARACPECAGLELLSIERGYPTPHEPRLIGETPSFLTKYSNIFVDVVCETGMTFEFLQGLEWQVRTQTCALITKGTDFTPTYCGLTLVTAQYLQGYGMGPARHLKWIEEV